MIDGIDAIGQLGATFFTPPGGNESSSPDPARLVDVVNFENAFQGGEIRSDRSMTESGIVELGGGPRVDATGESSLGQNLLGSISEMDGGYRQITERITDWPSFSSYLENRGIGTLGPVMDQTGHISNIDEVLAKRVPETSQDLGTQVDQAYQKLEAHQKEANEFYAAGLDYQQDSAIWFLGTEFWLTKVKVLTSAVTQVSSGLKTLFMSQ